MRENEGGKRMGEGRSKRGREGEIKREGERERKREKTCVRRNQSHMITTDAILNNVPTFVGILLEAYGSANISWTLDDYKKALKWAEYFEKVCECVCLRMSACLRACGVSVRCVRVRE